MSLTKTLLAVAAVVALQTGHAIAQSVLPPPNLPLLTPPNEPPPDYRAIIRRSAGGLFVSETRAGPIEIADGVVPFQTSTEGLVWKACIRVNLNGQPLNYAIFIRRGAVVDLRGGVVGDQCINAVFSHAPGTGMKGNHNRYPQ